MARAVPRGHGLSSLEIASGSGRLEVRAPGRPVFRLPSETPVPTGRGSCACHSGVYLSAPGSVGRPWPLRSPASLPLLAPFAPVPVCQASAGLETSGHWLRAWGPGILSLATVNNHGQVQSKDAHAGLPNSKAEMRNQAPTSPAHCPSGLFPLGEKVGQLCSGLEWSFGTFGARLALCPLPPPHQLLALAGSRSLSGASGGTARAHGSGGSGCGSGRLPGSKVPS